MLSRVRHPHIVRLLGSGSIPRKYLVLEYLSGGTLSHTLGVRPGESMFICVVIMFLFLFCVFLSMWDGHRHFIYIAAYILHP